MRVYVVCANLLTYRLFIKKYHVNPSMYTYLDRLEKIKGLAFKSATIILTDGYYHQPEIEEILQEAKIREFHVQKLETVPGRLYG